MRNKVIETSWLDFVVAFTIALVLLYAALTPLPAP